MLNDIVATEPCTILKIHGRDGNLKMNKSDIFTVHLMNSDVTQKIKSNCKGIVNFKCLEGDIKQKDDVLCVFSPCPHDIVISGICGLCSIPVEIQNCGNGEIKCPDGSRLAMLHYNKNVVVKKEAAIEIALKDYVSLLKKRKLSLLVDLDATILHSTDKYVPNEMKDVFHYTMRADQSSSILLNYHTKFRPFLKQFLTEMNNFYEMHIYTFGNKSYAEKIAEIIDPDKRFFGQRIISKDDSFDPMKKSANLKSLFPRGDNMVCIIDDRTDVWNNAPNCIHVQPYMFFPEIGDINDPDRSKDSLKFMSNRFQYPSLWNVSEKVVEKSENQPIETNPENNQNPSIKINTENNENESITSNSHNNENQPIETSLANNQNQPIETSLANNQNQIIETSHANNESQSKEISLEIIQNESIEAPSVVTDNQSTEPFSQLSNEELIERTEELKPAILDQPRSTEIEIDKSQNPTCQQIADPDCYLLSLANILKEIHRQFYDEIDQLLEKSSVQQIIENNSLPDVKDLMTTMRLNILRGCRVNFSGLIPLNQKVKETYEYRMLTSLGAEYLNNVSLPSLRSRPDICNTEGFTTHLICKSEGTKKMKQVAHYITEINRLITEKPDKLPKSIHVAHLVKHDWLWQSYFFWQKVNENDFCFNPNLKQLPIPSGFSEMVYEGVSKKSSPVLSRKRNASKDDSDIKMKIARMDDSEKNVPFTISEKEMKELDDLDNESISGISTDSFEESGDSYNDHIVSLDNPILHYSLQEQLEMFNEVDEAMDEEKYDKLKSPVSSDYYKTDSSSSSNNSDVESDDFKNPPKNWQKAESSNDSNSYGEHEIDYGDFEESCNKFGLIKKDNAKSDFDEFFDDLND